MMLEVELDCVKNVSTYVLHDSRKGCFDVYIDCTITVIEIKRSHTKGMLV